MEFSGDVSVELLMEVKVGTAAYRGRWRSVCYGGSRGVCRRKKKKMKFFQSKNLHPREIPWRKSLPSKEEKIFFFLFLFFVLDRERYLEEGPWMCE